MTSKVLPSSTMSATDVASSTKGVPVDADQVDDVGQESTALNLLWLPYVCLTLILLAMAFSSFFRYHINNKAKYLSKTKVEQKPRPLKFVPKYRVTMSRSGAIKPVDFNILDFGHKVTDPCGSRYETASDTEYGRQTSPPEVHNHLTGFPTAAASHDYSDHMAAMHAQDEMQNHHVSVLAAPSPDETCISAESISCHKTDRIQKVFELQTQRRQQKPLPPSREAYLNEAYDSNCDSDKSLISQKGVRKLKELGFHNESFESSESSCPSETDKSFKTAAPKEMYLGNPSSHSAKKPRVDPGLDSVYYHTGGRSYTEPDILIHSVPKKLHPDVSLQKQRPAPPTSAFAQSSQNKKRSHNPGSQNTKSSVPDTIDTYGIPQVHN